MPILYDNPREVGADRIVNAVAAYEKHRGGLIVVDFGTATTFDAVTPKGEYLGGASAPGITISMEALFQNASKLPRVEFARPPHVVGKNTVHSMQSGLVFGYVGLVDGICERMATRAGLPGEGGRHRRPGAADRRRVEGASRRSTSSSPSRGCASSGKERMSDNHAPTAFESGCPITATSCRRTCASTSTPSAPVPAADDGGQGAGAAAAAGHDRRALHAHLRPGRERARRRR